MNIGQLKEIIKDIPDDVEVASADENGCLHQVLSSTYPVPWNIADCLVVKLQVMSLNT
jgi:hypothetical protein